MMKIKLFLKTIILFFGLSLINTAEAATTYTLTAGADPSVLTNWGKISSVVGSHPASFTLTSTTWSVSSSCTMTNPWSVTGSGSKIIIASGTFSDGGFAFTPGVILQINPGATLLLKNTTSTLGSFNLLVGSTVNYGATSGTQTIYAETYYNLTISGTASMILGGIITVNTTLTINSGCTLTLNSLILNIAGTITGSGTITGDTNGSEVDIEGSGNVGLVNFTASHDTLDNFIINSGSVTLGTNLVVSGAGSGSVFDQSSGSVNLNGYTLTLDTDCDASFGDSGSNVITGSSTSNLIINSNSSFGGSISNSLFMDQTSSTFQSLSNLTLNSDQTLTLGNNLNIIDSISPTSGTIRGALTLIADQTTVGHVGRVGFVGGDISGISLTSQVYHNPPPGNTTNWMLMGVAGISGTGFSQWNSEFYMYCPTCPRGTNLGGGNTFTSITTYNEPGDSFPAINYTAAYPVGTGYWVYLGTTSPGTASGAESISVTGTPVQGSGTWSGLTYSPLTNTSYAGSNLLANPYPSPISWDKVIAANGGILGSTFLAGLNTVYVWCPTLDGGIGDYATYQSLGGAPGSGISCAPTGSGISYSPGAANIDDKLAAGQGFYVVTNGTSSSINYSESIKVMSGSDSSFLMRKSHTNNVQATSSSFAYFYINATAGINAGSAVISFNPNGTNGVDPYDSRSMPWNNVVQISTTIQGKSYVINGLPNLTTNYAIPVKILSGTTSQYAISTANMASLPSGACLILHDNYGVMPDQDLRGGAFNVTINDTETVARFVLNITVLPLNITTNTRQASCNNTHDGLITAVGNDAGPWNYTWKNGSGTVVKTSLNKATADSLTGLNNGVYSVDVSTVGTCNSATQTFTITAPAAPTSVFTAPTTVNIGTNVNFTNNSTNATNYIWYFGNGDISSQQTPSYNYNNTGTYTITLDVIIASCNDTVKSSQVITVEATTGIKQISDSGNITLSRDGSGNYLQFDYASPTKVNITVYNILGQNLLKNVGVTVENDRVYLNVIGSENQVLYVTITNLSNNQQTTRKFVND